MARETVLEELFEAAPEAVGLAMIITNDYKDNPKYSNLEATESDGASMAAAFTELGYTIVHKHNITGLILASILRRTSNIQYPKSCKRIAFVFAGHGRNESKSETTLLIMNDGESITIDFIVETLSPRDPGNAIGNKVRMFFIDACRGDGKDEGRLVPRGGDCIEKQRLSSNAANYLLCFSTLAGFQSYEVKETGGGSRGLWLPRIARNLTTCDDSIGDILVKVNEELSTEFQDKEKYPYMMQPVLTQTLNESVFLLREKPQGLSVKHTAKTTSSDKDQRSNLYHRATSLPTKPSAGQASRPELAAAFSQQTHGAQIHTSEQSLPPVFAQSTSLPGGNLCVTPPSRQKCQVEAREGATSLPSRIELVQRKAPLPDDSGYYKKQLNELMQKKIISDSYTKSWKVVPDPKIQGKFKATVECVLLVGDNSTVSGDSKEYYDKKNLAKEAAAEDAVRKIEKILPRAASASISSPPPIAIVRSDIPVLMNKQNLNNHFQGELRDSLPIYDTVPVDSGFQCSITHKRFGIKAITGDVCSSKREAEDSAASKALKHC
ncbi:PREDICTED: uncharacterized protein LOC105313442 isoform X2 [Amphimedon queenslandica]|uniref:Caspase family p20 domain-containing protein n=1 Tax=Amphimedon queenslandica TaxID=400682 RepID=A0AAN0JBN5_AMPQE|nr:PREDICTED: uncharacterized protein LOC105313442 isoform X2 [Amphimedon queenslandica]|eukprot:XP_019854404.1 PREDICTED: uncharacterized protein LOC105313442 isoform X2 [Amphimedon queenslandica]